MLAIHLAWAYNKYDIVELFLNNRVPPNVIWNKVDKATPLHYAVVSKDPKLVELVWGKKADPNQKDQVGNTPYHFAAIMESAEVMEVLEKYHGDALIKNLEGQTAVQIVIDSKNPECIKFIAKHKKYADVMFK